MKKHAEKKQQLESNWLLIGAGSMFAATVIVGFILGYFLDRWLDTSPWLMLGLGVLGFVGGILRLMRTLI